MPTTTFSSGVTVLQADWCQEVNDHVFGSATVGWTYGGAITITGTSTLRSGVLMNTNVSSPGAASMYKNSGTGMTLQAATGSSYDFAVIDSGNANYIMRTPNGTFNLETIGTLITAASTTTRAGLRLLTGVAPTSPVDGDMWQDGTNAKIRINGVTKTFTLT